MQKDTKSIFLYVLAFVIALVLNSAKNCTNAPVAKPVIAEPEIVYKYIPEYHTIEKVVLRNIVIHDTTQLREFVLKDTTIFFYRGDTIVKYPDSMRIYEGTAQSDRCTHNYLTGIWHDSIQFFHLRTECEQEEPAVIVRPGGQPKFEWGITAAWAPLRPKSFPGLGLHARTKSLYFGAEYFPTEGSTFIRAGVFLPRK